ncbi:MAG: hypothetical protein KDD33_04265 [Bdellovibrionales bacterium]|nr:hypothetical protein [Bdellovibrionales bacterium]
MRNNKMKYLVMLASLLLLTPTLQAKDSCQSCDKLNSLTVSHSKVKGANDEILEDSVDRALAAAINFKFSSKADVRKKEVKAMVKLLVSLSQDDKTGTAIEILDDFSRTYPSKAVRKLVNQEISQLPAKIRQKIRKDMEQAAKIKRQGNG